MNIRCWGTGIPIYEEYHDTEWGLPLHDDGKLFEFLILEGMQAELNGKRKNNYRTGFDSNCFDLGSTW